MFQFPFYFRPDSDQLRSVMGKLTFLLLVISFLASIACKDQNQEQAQESRTPNMLKEETLKESSRNYLKAWTDFDTILLKKITIRNVVRNVNGEIASSNQKGITETMLFWHTALPDFKVVEKEIIIEGNRTYVSWTSTGTNTGMFGEMAPTGKKSNSEGFSILTFDDSQQLIHENAYYDLLGVMKDWGYSLNPPNTE